MLTLRSRASAALVDLDEPTELEDTKREVPPVSEDDLDPADRQALEAAFSRSAAQIALGELIDAAVVLGRLGPRRQ
jgi:hypothetical protein